MTLIYRLKTFYVEQNSNGDHKPIWKLKHLLYLPKYVHFESFKSMVMNTGGQKFRILTYISSLKSK